MRAASWEEAVVDTGNREKEGCESELVEHCDACCGAVQGDGTKLLNVLYVDAYLLVSE